MKADVEVKNATREPWLICTHIRVVMSSTAYLLYCFMLICLIEFRVKSLCPRFESMRNFGVYLDFETQFRYARSDTCTKCNVPIQFQLNLIHLFYIFNIVLAPLSHVRLVGEVPKIHKMN